MPHGGHEQRDGDGDEAEEEDHDHRVLLVHEIMAQAGAPFCDATTCEPDI